MATFSVEEISPVKRRIHAEVEPEQVALHLENAYRKIARTVRLPGFRAGKVPRRMIESRFKGDAINEALQMVVTQAYREALEKNPQVEPVAMPEVVLERYDEGKPFKFEAVVEVKPKINPSRLEGLTLKAGKLEVSDADVEAELEKIQKQMSHFHPIEDRTVARKGDFTGVAFEATIDGKEFPGSKSDSAMFEVAEGELAKGRVLAMEGLEIGGVREFDYTFPADAAENLAGKKSQFKVTLKELKRLEGPELNDAFAQSLGEFSDLAALRARVRSDLTEQAKQVVARDQKRDAVTQLLERNPFDVPQALVERTTDNRIQEILNRLQQQGLDPSKAQVDFTKLRESLREEAVRDVKAALLFEAIADQQKLAASNDEVLARIDEMATRMGYPAELARRSFGEEQREGLRGQLREEKTLAFLVSKANIS